MLMNSRSAANSALPCRGDSMYGDNILPWSRSMSFRWPVAVLVILFGTSFSRADEPPKPRLAVLVVFDQMRGDYLEKWQPLFGVDGFRRLQTEGAWFANCHYPYAVTQT